MTAQGAPEDAGFLYVTRLPPSPSGVALYARDFLQVLKLKGATRVIRMPPRPECSQRLTAFPQAWSTLRRAMKERPDDIVFFELAGRGLVEFWVAMCASRLSTSRIWLTIHDAPEISGGAFFFRSLDRKGLRRLAAALSRTVGRRAEGFLLRRCEAVFALSETGVRELEARYGKDARVRRIAHVVALPAVQQKKPIIFLPGYLSGMTNIDPVLDALEAVPSDWTLEVGGLDDDTAIELDSSVRRRGLQARVRVLGFQPENELLTTFAEASIVVRWRASGWAKAGMPQHGAVSGPLMHALASECAVVTNDTRGSVLCLRAAKAIQVTDGDAGAAELRLAVVRLVTDVRLRETTAEAGRLHYEFEHTPSAVAYQLEPQ